MIYSLIKKFIKIFQEKGKYNTHHPSASLSNIPLIPTNNCADCRALSATKRTVTCSSQKERPGQAWVFAARILFKAVSLKSIIQPQRHWTPICAVTSGLAAANVVPCRHSHPSAFHAS